MSKTRIGYVTIKFTSQELDEETGLYYYRARFYDPQLGRFLTPDTIIPDWYNPEAFNRYAYVLNNPIRYIDPSGHIPLMSPMSYDFDHLLGELHIDLEQARQIANEVLQEAQNTGLPGLHNGPGDAWRHSRWNERMSKEINELTSKAAGYGHELENIYEQLKRGEKVRWDELKMDLHNNRMGRSGKSATKLLNAGDLNIIDPHNYSSQDTVYDEPESKLEEVVNDILEFFGISEDE